MINMPILEKFNSTKLENGTVYLLQGVKIDSYYDYSKQFKDLGYVKKEERVVEGHNFAAFLFDTTGVFINYFAGTHELYVVVEEDTKYFSYTDKKRNINVRPQLTHVELDLFGMSYFVRLSDGRFVIFDGGTVFADAERLLNLLKAGTKEEKPVIAAWVITHPHADHYLGMKFFLENFMEEVVIESFMYNFPKLDDYEHFPFLGAFNSVNNSCVNADFVEIYKLMDKTGTDIYTTHTGQIYEISGVKFEILVSVDDVMNTLATDNVNATSMVVKFEIAGQTVLLTGDARSSDSKLVKKYREYLKCDLFQAPHHGYKSGTHSAEMLLYDYADPKVCFLPIGEENAFRTFCPFRLGTKHLLTRINFEEFITGAPTRTLDLPYTPPKYAREEFKARLEAGINSNGARTWVFSGLNTSDPEDFEFALSNLIYWDADVTVEAYFEQPTPSVRNIKTLVKGFSVNKINLLEENLTDLPENTACTVRFRCENPIIVSGNKRVADYKT